MEGIIRVGVCFFCHDGQGRYLLSKRSQNCRDEQGAWDPGGGGLKFGESVEEALHREVQEEYAAKPLSVEFLGFRDVLRAINNTTSHWVMFDYRVHLNADNVKNNEPHKCDGLRWVTIPELDSMQDPIHSQFPAYLAKYRHLFI